MAVPSIQQVDAVIYIYKSNVYDNVLYKTGWAFKSLTSLRERKPKAGAQAACIISCWKGYFDNTTDADDDLSKLDTSRGGWLWDRRDFSIHRFTI